jgi:polar amino acid transport system ATP-binding protein
LEVPDAGSITVNGDVLFFANYSKLKEEEIRKNRHHFGMVFQQFNLFNNMTVIENICLAPITHKIMTKEKTYAEAKKLLKSIDLEDIADSYPNQISGGQKQRVAIIRTLIMKPDMILFDEPTSALDPEMIGEVTNLMKKLAKDGMTMIIVSHELNFIKNFCNRVVFIDDGVVVEEGSSKEIFNNPTDKRLKSFLKKIDNK